LDRAEAHEMALQIVGTTKFLEQALLGLQAFQVAFLWLHDWLPLGRLNDVAAVRRQHTLGWLWISYGILLVGQIRAWWIPYLFKPEPARAERSQKNVRQHARVFAQAQWDRAQHRPFAPSCSNRRHITRPFPEEMGIVRGELTERGRTF